MHALEGDLLEELLAASSRKELEADGRSEQAEARLRGLQECLLELSPDAKQLIRNRYYENRPIGEIAGLCDRSQTWVAVTLFRIRKTLLTCMRQRGVA
jgi:RNA polymerase sigma-70 factor (ECF subfamily)